MDIAFTAERQWPEGQRSTAENSVAVLIDGSVPVRRNRPASSIVTAGSNESAVSSGSVYSSDLQEIHRRRIDPPSAAEDRERPSQRLVYAYSPPRSDRSRRRPGGYYDRVYYGLAPDPWKPPVEPDGERRPGGSTLNFSSGRRASISPPVVVVEPASVLAEVPSRGSTSTNEPPVDARHVAAHGPSGLITYLRRPVWMWLVVLVLCTVSGILTTTAHSLLGLSDATTDAVQSRADVDASGFYANMSNLTLSVASLAIIASRPMDTRHWTATVGFLSVAVISAIVSAGASKSRPGLALWAGFICQLSQFLATALLIEEKANEKARSEAYELRRLAV